MPTSVRHASSREQLLLDWSGPAQAASAAPANESATSAAQTEPSAEPAATFPVSVTPLRLSPEAAAIVHAHLPPPNIEQHVRKEENSEQPNEPLERLPTSTHPPLVQVVPWDFRTSFPGPLDEAIEAGKLHEDDADPENLRSLHEEHARHALALLSDLDAVMDAKRRGVDPRSGKAPRTPKQRENLQAMFRDEPARLEHAFDTLMDGYEEAFGPEATDAFRKAIRACHAGLDVVSERPPHATPRLESVVAGVFGTYDDGTAVAPAAEEVAAITEQVTDQLIPLPDGPERQALLTRYSEDFGEEAAEELDRWCRLKAEANEHEQFNYDPGHPWHYYREGDDADPLPADSIPARRTSLEDIHPKWPTDPAKRRLMMEQLLTTQQRQLREDEQRYRELVERGVDALSSYDRGIAHGGDDELAHASAVALSYSQISSARGRIECLRQQLAIADRRG